MPEESLRNPSVEAHDLKNIGLAIGFSVLATPGIVTYALARETGIRATKLGRGLRDAIHGSKVMGSLKPQTVQSAQAADSGVGPGEVNTAYDGRNW